MSISKRLAKAIEPFTAEEVPETIEEAEKSITKHQLTRRKTLDILHVDDLALEGEKISERMQVQSAEVLGANPDVTNTMVTIQKLLSQIGTVKERLEVLWSDRYNKLRANLHARVFEKEAHQVCAQTWVCSLYCSGLITMLRYLCLIFYRP